MSLLLPPRIAFCIFMLLYGWGLAAGCDESGNRKAQNVPKDGIELYHFLERVTALARAREGRWPAESELSEEPLLRSGAVIYGAGDLENCFNDRVLVATFTYRYQSGHLVVGWSTGEAAFVPFEERRQILSEDAANRERCGAPPIDVRIHARLTDPK